MVRARCSRLLVSQLAVCRHCDRKVLSSSRAALARHRRGIGLVDQHARQRLGIQLDQPGAVARRAHDHVRRDRLDRRAAEGAAGLGIEPADFRQHVA